MSQSLKPLIESALALPESERANLALQLLRSLAPPGIEISEEQLDHQVGERLHQQRSGETGSAAEVSCTDLAGDLVGSLDGPSDLATNSKHLHGYGE